MRFINTKIKYFWLYVEIFSRQSAVIQFADAIWAHSTTWRISKNNLKILHADREEIEMNKLNNRMASERGNGGGSSSSSKKNYIFDHKNNGFLEFFWSFNHYLEREVVSNETWSQLRQRHFWLNQSPNWLFLGNQKSFQQSAAAALGLALRAVMVSAYFRRTWKRVVLVRPKILFSSVIFL